MPSALSEKEIARELADYKVVLPSDALKNLAIYLELLLHWNRRVNLTGLKHPRTIVRRLFAESLYAANVVELAGWLVDIGSGAGFPGLAVKLVSPELRVTLVEARQKKCAFLKEVVGQCGFAEVEVAAERFETWAGSLPPQRQPGVITTRAVDMVPELLQIVNKLLAPGGSLVLFTTRQLAARITRAPGWEWLPFEPYPPDSSKGLQIAHTRL